VPSSAGGDDDTWVTFFLRGSSCCHVDITATLSLLPSRTLPAQSPTLHPPGADVPPQHAVQPGDSDPKQQPLLFLLLGESGGAPPSPDVAAPAAAPSHAGGPGNTRGRRPTKGHREQRGPGSHRWEALTARRVTVAGWGRGVPAGVSEARSPRFHGASDSGGALQGACARRCAAAAGPPSGLPSADPRCSVGGSEVRRGQGKAQW